MSGVVRWWMAGSDEHPTCYSRLASIPSTSGRWGKFLASLLLFGWGFNLLFGDQTMMQWEAIQTIVSQVGCRPLGWWLMAIGILPMVGVATDWIAVSIIGETLAFTSWMTIGFSAIITGSYGRAAMWTCLVGALAGLNSEYQLVRRLYLKRR